MVAGLKMKAPLITLRKSSAPEVYSYVFPSSAHLTNFTWADNVFE